MKYLILVLIATPANAADPKPVYLVGTEEVSVSEALIRSLKGEQVSKCVPVEAKASKSGTSIGLRNVKKKKAE